MRSVPLHINVEEHLNDVREPWNPVDLAQCNGQVVRLAKFAGSFHWHSHEQDELFFVYRGSITIDVRDRAALVLREGEMGMIPKGVEHCPHSDGDSFVLMFEPATLKSGGDAS